MERGAPLSETQIILPAFVRLETLEIKGNKRASSIERSCGIMRHYANVHKRVINSERAELSLSVSRVANSTILMALLLSFKKKCTNIFNSCDLSK